MSNPIFIPKHRVLLVIPSFHTAANLQQGRGDPCRLVGYTVQQIRTELDAGRRIDNGQWRLPTDAENRAFINTTQNRSDWNTVNGSNGHYFRCPIPTGST